MDVAVEQTIRERIELALIVALGSAIGFLCAAYFAHLVGW